MRIPKLNKNKKYLLACSYGPDSMALFNLLIKDNIDFDVAIVNYHLREESNLEVAWLKRYCELNNKSLLEFSLLWWIKWNILLIFLVQSLI